MKKDVIKSLIALRQHEIPFEVIERDVRLPVERNKIITIPGVRRCGKSTMMELAINHLAQSGVDKRRILWLGFDDERLRYMKTEELDVVITAYMEMYPDIPIKEAYMFFDELQLVDGWEYFVLRLYKSYCKNIYVCGSNATMLSTELKTALRGYPLEYATYPLSFNEYCRFKQINTNGYTEQEKATLTNAWNAYCNGSAFPEVVLCDSASERTQILQGYFDTMLLRDLAEHYNIGNLQALRYFIKRIMANVTKPTSVLGIYNDIKSNGVKVSKDDLYKWANHVCDIFLFIRIHKYTHSLKKENASQDKFYCIDNGLRTSVLLPQSNEMGKNLENAVMLELQRRLLPQEKITYYGGAAECDFVVQQDEAVRQLIQVTWQMRDEETRQREIRGLLEAAKETHCDNLLIITADERTRIEIDDKIIEVLPAWEWALEKQKQQKQCDF